MPAIHTALDIAGLLPVVGEPLDAINAAIYLAQGDNLNAGLSAASMIPVVGSLGIVAKGGNKVAKAVEAGTKGSNGIRTVTKGMVKYQVGAYDAIRGVEGFDAHHVGQKAVMKKLVQNYNPKTAPAINVPKVGHTILGPTGILSRNTSGITNARQLLARDLFELRRIYPDISNSTLRELIDMNKKMYSEMRK